MAEPRTVTVYIDYKSPYAYLAKDLAYELARDFPVRLDWLPYDLDLADFMGSARVDGYRATLVAGTPTFENGEATGARPGRLVRNGR